MALISLHKIAQLPLIIAIILSFSLLGCVSENSRPKGVFSHLPDTNHGISMEVAASVDQQAAQEIGAFPAQFIIPIDEEPVVWSRAKLFLEKFLPTTGVTTPVIMKVVGKRWVLASNSKIPGGYGYEISRDELPGSYRLSVKCVPKSKEFSQQAAEMNAKNVARFLKEGRLEVSLLAK